MSKTGKTLLCSIAALAITVPVLGYAAPKDTSTDGQEWSFVENDNPFSMELVGIEVDPYTGNTFTDEC